MTRSTRYTAASKISVSLVLSYCIASLLNSNIRERRIFSPDRDNQGSQAGEKKVGSQKVGSQVVTSGFVLNVSLFYFFIFTASFAWVITAIVIEDRSVNLKH